MVEEKILQIKEWLGSGSINIFGLPMSGKDTVGRRLAAVLGGKFLSSGDILRQAAEQGTLTEKGELTPKDKFKEIVLPYFYDDSFAGRPLMLSAIGRWDEEMEETMTAAAKSGHPMKAVLLLNVSEADVWLRWEAAQALGDRTGRADDKTKEIFKTRLMEFRNKTAMTMMKYQKLGLLIHVDADEDRETVFEGVVEALWQRSQLTSSHTPELWGLDQS